MDFVAMLNKVLIKNGLIFAFVIIGITNLIAYKFAGLTKGRIHGSAVAIFFGLHWWRIKRIGINSLICRDWHVRGRNVS